MKKDSVVWNINVFTEDKNYGKHRTVWLKNLHYTGMFLYIHNCYCLTSFDPYLCDEFCILCQPESNEKMCQMYKLQTKEETLSRDYEAKQLDEHISDWQKKKRVDNQNLLTRAFVFGALDITDHPSTNEVASWKSTYFVMIWCIILKYDELYTSNGKEK